MEKEIADILNPIVKEKGYSKYYFQQNGIGNIVVDSILQQNNGIDKTYTVKSLFKFLALLGEENVIIGNTKIKI